MVIGSGALAGSPAIGLDALSGLGHLPLLRPGTLVHYVGSIDKKGGNADWDWGLYQDARGEWVLAEVDGPGCVWNFVVHHDIARSNPIYRFYFDGESEPRFSILHSEFGAKAPFIAPLADWYGPKLRSSHDPRVETMDFRIVRSFVPMPFAKGCRITSSVKLEGNSYPASGAGGWGHAIYHTYPTADGVTTFTGKEDLAPLLAVAGRLGENPDLGGCASVKLNVNLKPGASASIFASKGEGVVKAVKLRLAAWNREAIHDIWVRCYWEDESVPGINLPIGTFFGNERGDHTLKTLAMGLVTDGFSYQYLPMPYWKGARIELVNRSANSKSYLMDAEVLNLEGHVYDRDSAGHLRASPWRQPIPGQPGEDAVVADIAGHGHAVAGVVARLGGCEGDIRVHIDGRSTPSVQSDGSESWVCYGWGYYSAPEFNPFSAYDGPNSDASMLRLLLGDLYPFRQRLRLSAEPGNGVRTPDVGTVRTGSVLWYGEPGLGSVATDLLDVGDLASEKAHGYRAEGGKIVSATTFFEGAPDNLKISDEGRSGFSESSFTLKVASDNKGVILRRRSLQAEGRHRAIVEVDGKPVSERSWIWPDCNPHQSWLEDEFQIPASYTTGKSQLRIRVIPQPVDDRISWNECRYTAYSLGSMSSGDGVSTAVPGKELPQLPLGESAR